MIYLDWEKCDLNARKKTRKFSFNSSCIRQKPSICLYVCARSGCETDSDDFDEIRVCHKKRNDDDVQRERANRIGKGWRNMTLTAF